MDLQLVLCCMFVTTVGSDASWYTNQLSPSSDFEQKITTEQQNTETQIDDQVPFLKIKSTRKMNSANELEKENRMLLYETVKTTLKANHKETEIFRSLNSELGQSDTSPETKLFSDGPDDEIRSTALDRTFVSSFLISRGHFSSPTEEKIEDEVRIDVDQFKERETYTKLFSNGPEDEMTSTVSDKTDVSSFLISRGRFSTPTDEKLEDKVRIDLDQFKEREKYTKSPESEEQLCERLPCSSNRCSCDHFCLLFGDCCQIIYKEFFHAYIDQDIAEISLNTTDAFQSLGYDNSKMKEAKMFAEYGNCHNVAIGWPEYMVVDHCPQDFDNYFILKKCLDSGDLWDIPVFFYFSRDSQITFRNLFCAYCHGYTITDVSFWKASLHCPEGTNVTQLEKEECYVKKFPPLSGPKPHTCSPDQYVTCKDNKSQRPVADADVLCSAYVEPVNVYGTTYKNQHCFVCYDVSMTDIIFDCDYKGFHPLDQRPNYPGLDIFFAYDKSGLASEQLGNLFKINCAEGEIFDFISMSCQQIVCPKGYELTKSKCLSKTSVLTANNIPVSSTYRLGIVVNTSIVPDNEVSAVFEIFLQLAENAIEKIKQLVPNIEVQKIKTKFEDKINIRFSLRSSVSFYNITEDLKKLEVESSSYIKVSLENFDNDTTLVGCQNSTLVQLSNIDVDFDDTHNRVIGILPNKEAIDLFYTWFSISLFDNEVEFLAYCGKINEPLACSRYLKYTSNTFEISNDTITIFGRKTETDNYFIQNETLFLCAENTSTPIACSTLITYNSDEFVYSNGTLVVPGHKTVESTQFFIRNNTLYVCQKDIGSSINNLINTITDACLIVSLISLVIMITCHMSIKGLRNLHGKNIVNFSVCLFLAQGIFLVCRYVNVPHKILPFVSLCEHFLWLCVFSWTVVISTDIAKRMINMSGNISQDKKAEVKRHNRYRLFAFALPFVIVVVCGVLDYQMNYIGYGKDGGSCWISKPEGKLFFYIIPVSVALAYSLVCFLLISTQIELARRSSSIATVNNKNRITCGVYFKLCSILGLSWIIGIISSNVDAIALSYVNGIINGLQGFFLTVASLCNRRVLHMIRNNGKQSAKRSESRTATTNDTTM